MSIGSTALRKVQIGKESEHGNAVVATAMLVGKCSVEDDPKLVMPDDLELGRNVPHRFAKRVADMSKLKFEGPLSFEQILYWLLAGVQGGVTGSGSGEYTWTFSPSMVATNAHDSFTIETGDDVQAYKVAYVMASGLTIAGSLDAETKLSVDAFGKKKAAVSFAALAYPASFEIVPPAWTVCIDDTGASLGTNELATVLGFNLKLKTGLAPFKRLRDGYDFGSHAETPFSIELDMTLQYTSDAVTEYGYFSPALGEEQTKRFVRLEVEGTTISSNPRKITVDLCGVYTKFSPLGEKDGLDVVDVTLATVPDDTWAKVFEIVVVNDLGTLP